MTKKKYYKVFKYKGAIHVVSGKYYVYNITRSYTNGIQVIKAHSINEAREIAGRLIEFAEANGVCLWSLVVD